MLSVHLAHVRQKQYCWLLKEKLGVASPYIVMPLKSVSGIVLHGKTPRAFVRVLKQLGLDVHLA